jgi:MerR family transcriptional regulator, copper efflux regulator
VLDASGPRLREASAPPLASTRTTEARDVNRLLRVGDLAKEVGKTVRALHLYEELELVEPAARSKGGFRLYDDHALVRIRWISKLQEMGLSLSEIQEVSRALGAAQTAPTAMARLLDTYQVKLRETQVTIAKLQALEAELLESVAYLETCGAECETTEVITACTTCNMHSSSAAAATASAVTEPLDAAMSNAVPTGNTTPRGAAAAASRFVANERELAATGAERKCNPRPLLPDLIRGIYPAARLDIVDVTGAVAAAAGRQQAVPVSITGPALTMTASAPTAAVAKRSSSSPEHSALESSQPRSTSLQGTS